jgi:hypothetical protein
LESTSSDFIRVNGIKADGLFATDMFSFYLTAATPSASQIYHNMVFGLEINGNSFYIYPFSNTDGMPRTFSSTPAILTDAEITPYDNNIVIVFQSGMMIASSDSTA